MTETIGDVVLSQQKFIDLLSRVSARTVSEDLGISKTDSGSATDWDYGLFCVSALFNSGEYPALEAGLRITYGCLQSDSSALHHREAAVLLLARIGNWPSIRLAEQRQLVGVDSWHEAPDLLRFETARRQLQMTIGLPENRSFLANQFQRGFWDAAQENDWLSVSAPTSAGKSFIVKQWLASQLYSAESFKAAYIVPTRALIAEVQTDLSGEFGTRIGIHTLPWEAGVGENEREILVVTQERLHLFQQTLIDLSFNIIFVDEAQKIGDGERGVLLHRTLETAVERNPQAQMIFASPSISNPGVLLRGAPSGVRSRTINAPSVTVGQNLLWANQLYRKPVEWSLTLVGAAEGPIELGTFVLAARPTNAAKRLAYVAFALGSRHTGNIVYVNGPADAEKVAQQLFDLLGGPPDGIVDQEIRDLQELVENAIHPQYSLRTVLARGVAFHYGNMPQLVRLEIERLFRSGKLKYLVCTSTLLEGVNLPCKNIFLRGPTKGHGKPMVAADFWNLAGRAGRWGKEFQGNIVCIDTSDQAQWPDPPTSKMQGRIHRSTDRVLEDPSQLLTFIDAGAIANGEEDQRLVESFYSYLATRVIQGLPLAEIRGLQTENVNLNEIEHLVAVSAAGVSLPVALLERNAGISPVAMQNLLDHLRRLQAPLLELPMPESADAAAAYRDALEVCDEYLGSRFGPYGRRYQLAILITQWMRGIPLRRLIAGSLRYNQEIEKSRPVASVIRGVMSDVESVARFLAPKYLGCFNDLARFAAGLDVATPPSVLTPDFAMMLELGVSRATEVALLSLGLSRTSAVALSDFITRDNLSPQECLTWIRSRQLAEFGLPVLVVREIRALAGIPESIASADDEEV